MTLPAPGICRLSRWSDAEHRGLQDTLESYQDPFRWSSPKRHPIKFQWPLFYPANCQGPHWHLSILRRRGRGRGEVQSSLLHPPPHVFLSNQWEKMGTRSPSPPASCSIPPLMGGVFGRKKKIGVSKRKLRQSYRCFTQMKEEIQGDQGLMWDLKKEEGNPGGRQMKRGGYSGYM